jgi:hypothetical protein
LLRVLCWLGLLALWKYDELGFCLLFVSSSGSFKDQVDWFCQQLDNSFLVEILHEILIVT